MSIIVGILSIFDTTTFISFVVFVSIVLHIFSNNRRKNLPPGPINLPIVGYAPFAVGKKLENVFSDLSKKYGEVVYFKIGTKSIVALNSYDAIKEMLTLNTETAVTRPNDFNALNYVFKDIGLLVENGKIWQDQRRFLMTTLRDLGFGKENLESQIRDEALILVEEIEKYAGRPFDPDTLLMGASANIISALSFGIRYKRHDPAFKELMRIYVGLANDINPFHILTIFPYLRFILPDFLSGMVKLRYIRDHIHKFAEAKIQDHESTSNNMQDYSDIYLSKQKSDIATGILDTSFNRDRLRSNMLTLSSAGTTTTATSIKWLLKLLMQYPQMQKKIQEEIDAVIGSERIPTYSDRTNMPYMEAFTLEGFRYTSLVQFGVPHSTLVGTKISDYDIPAGVTILPMIFMVHNDPKIWGDPENFRPERFLDAYGKLTKPETLIPFGMGKRSCPGENLAKTEIFIYLTNMLRQFTFSAPSKEDLDTSTEVNTFTRELPPFKIIAQRRVK